MIPNNNSTNKLYKIVQLEVKRLNVSILKTANPVFGQDSNSLPGENHVISEN